MNIQRIKVNLPDDLHIFHPGNIYWGMNLNLNLNSLLVKRQIDNPSPGAVTGGN